MGEEESQETEMGERTLFGSFRQDCAHRVTESQHVGQVGYSSVRAALRRCGGRKASLIASGASEKDLVWCKGQESDVESYKEMDESCGPNLGFPGQRVCLACDGCLTQAMLSEVARRILSPPGTLWSGFGAC